MQAPKLLFLPWITQKVFKVFARIVILLRCVINGDQIVPILTGADNDGKN
jgi:hypothetical protein